MNNLHVGDKWMPLVNDNIKYPKGYIELTLDDGSIVNGMTVEDIEACSTGDYPDMNITVGGVTFRKDQVKKVRFGEDFDLTSLQFFGFNFISLMEVDRIPDSVNGDYCLQCFLQGCIVFDSPITIPEGITGRDCLNNFLFGCTSFNHPIVIPEGVSGQGCLSGFLDDCSSFNQPITIPEGVTGVDCIDGFLGGCDNMISPVTVNDASGLNGNIYTLATPTNDLAPMYVQGVPIIGDAADAFRAKFPNMTILSYRNLI